MAQITKDEFQKLYSEAPQGTNPEDLIKSLQSRGHTLEGLSSTPTPEKSIFKNMVSNIGTDIAETGKKIAGEFIPKKPEETTTYQKVSSALGGKILNVAGDVAGGLTDIAGEVIGAGAKKLYETTYSPEHRKLIEQNAANLLDTPVGQAGISAIKGGVEKYNQWKTENPNAAKDLESVVNVASILPAEKIVGGAIKTGTEAIKGTGIAGKVTEKLGEKVAKKATETAIEAVSPELKGKALVEAYKKGAGTTTKLGTQVLEDTKETIRIAENLKDVLKSKNPLKNLDSLGNAMNETEGKLTTLLETDKTPIIKKSVSDTLDTLKEIKPREYIRDPQASSIYDDAIEFAKETVNKNEPTINGMRNARKAFDQAAKNEFPSAFKNGVIDTKTAAGKAIKEVRDTLNNYLYDTAAEGSEIKELIRRESDIFKAIDNIAPKAAKTHGKNIVQKFIKKHPVAGSALKYGAAATGGAVVGKELGIIP